MIPFFTIITATYNAAATLPRLLDSLADQTCRDFNWIVQDGKSTDNTMQIVAKYAEKLPSILCESTKDTGIYDAWNKALNRTARNGLGKWVLFLGADDLLANPTVLEETRACLEILHAEVLYAVGGLTNFEESGEKEILPISVRSAFAHRHKGMTIPHSSLFTSGCLLCQYRFDANFRIVGDHEFLLRTWLREDQLVTLNVLVTRMSQSGISSLPQYAAAIRSEYRSILQRHYPLTWSTWPAFLFLYGDSLCFSPKMHLKAWLQRYNMANKIWNALSMLKKKHLL